MGPASNTFIDRRFILPTSNDCERVFSKVGYLLNDLRKSVLPMNLESQIFLNVDNDLWSGADMLNLLE